MGHTDEITVCDAGLPIPAGPERIDLALMAGYHSPQVEVEVRLNTNESPEPPPASWRDALAAELSRVEWHRYPDRAATELRQALADHHGVDPAMVFVANGSNEVIQSSKNSFENWPPGSTVRIGVQTALNS
jgi:histidinol-phosphate aminotransferase